MYYNTTIILVFLKTFQFKNIIIVILKKLQAVEELYIFKPTIVIKLTVNFELKMSG